MSRDTKLFWLARRALFCNTPGCNDKDVKWSKKESSKTKKTGNSRRRSKTLPKPKIQQTTTQKTSTTVTATPTTTATTRRCGAFSPFNNMQIFFNFHVQNVSHFDHKLPPGVLYHQLQELLLMTFCLLHQPQEQQLPMTFSQELELLMLS